MYKGEVVELRAKVKQLSRDVRDMNSAPCAVFHRCGGCGRVAAQGWICPTVAEGGDCETGR